MPTLPDDQTDLHEGLSDLRARALAGANYRVGQIKTRIWRWLRPRILGVAVSALSLYRLRLRRTTFIGVTGSCGKTTTKEMVDEVLSSEYLGLKSRGNSNVLKEVIRLLLHIRRYHDYCVQEFAIGGIGEAVPMEKQFKMFKPRIGVVTTVGDDHIDAHGSREAIAAAKGKLIAALPKDGTAVLNADDDLVLQMQERCNGRVVTYGLSTGSMVRGEDVRDDWPSRLSMTVRHGEDSVHVQTQLCGAHLVPNVLAAIAVGRVMGISIQEAARAIEQLKPVEGRMFPVERPDGVTFIVDDAKAPVWTIPATLQFLGRASAKRKIIILGSLSDRQARLDPTYVDVARQALDIVDHVFFVGQWASRALRARRHPDDHALQAFVDTDHLAGFLRGFLEPGDLVLVKGSPSDHLSHRLSSVIHAPTTEVDGFSGASVCSRTATTACVCPADAGGAVEILEGVSQIVVGLGNPGSRFAQTPHNVGQQVLDELAEMLHAPWSKEEFGLASRAHLPAGAVLLVKPATEMNEIGPWMRDLVDSTHLVVADCLIIQDDINLKPGDVRNRLRGSSGGHNGVQSIIAAFESEEIRRVKIGVGSPPEGTPALRYVLTPVRTELRETIDDACHEAAVRALGMIKEHTLSTRGSTKEVPGP